MAKKSRFQMVNRGRKGAPRWTVEETKPNGEACYVYSSRIRANADGFLSNIRRMERDESLNPVTVHHITQGATEAAIVHRCRTIADAEAWIAAREATDPAGVANGDYSIDYPESMEP